MLILLEGEYFSFAALGVKLHPPKRLGSTGGSVVNNPPAVQEHERCRFDPSVGKIPWRRKWQTTPVFLLGESRGQRSPAGYSP